MKLLWSLPFHLQKGHHCGKHQLLSVRCPYQPENQPLEELTDLRHCHVQADHGHPTPNSKLCKKHKEHIISNLPLGNMMEKIIS